MDKAIFQNELFGTYPVPPDQDIMDKAVRKAESDCKIKVADIAEDAIERDWLENRTERHFIWECLHGSAQEYSYSPSGSRDQIFQHYKEMLEVLEAKWAEIKIEMRKRAGWGLRVIQPAFRYSSITGRPIL